MAETAQLWASGKATLSKHTHMTFLVMGYFMAELKIPIVPYFSGRKHGRQNPQGILKPAR